VRFTPAAAAIGVLLLIPTHVQPKTDRRPYTLNETYGGPHEQAFLDLRHRIPGLMQAAQVEMAAAMGLRYERGFRYPLQVGFVDEGAKGAEHALAFVKLYQGSTGIRQELWVNLSAYAANAFDFEKVFLHEMNHVILSDALGANVFSRVPIWFVEGVALYVAKQGEQLTRAEAHRYPGYASRMLVGSLETPRHATFYPQYYLALRYITEKSGEAILPLLIQDLVAKRSIQDAIQNHLREDWSTFQQHVREFSTEYLDALGTGNPFRSERAY